MNIVSTDKAESKFTYARNEDGKINLGAYIGRTVLFSIPDMEMKVEGTVSDARVRYGHLDLLVEPTKGTGSKWFERKNVLINDDPGEVGATQEMTVDRAMEIVESSWFSSLEKKFRDRVGVDGYNR
jgi:hypothetical protein